jgi:hypothetical protein
MDARVMVQVINDCVLKKLLFTPFFYLRLARPMQSKQEAIAAIKAGQYHEARDILQKGV